MLTIIFGCLIGWLGTRFRNGSKESWLFGGGLGFFVAVVVGCWMPTYDVSTDRTVLSVETKLDDEDREPYYAVKIQSDGDGWTMTPLWTYKTVVHEIPALSDHGILRTTNRFVKRTSWLLPFAFPLGDGKFVRAELFVPAHWHGFPPSLAACR